MPVEEYKSFGRLVLAKHIPLPGKEHLFERGHFLDKKQFANNIRRHMLDQSLQGSIHYQDIIARLEDNRARLSEALSAKPRANEAFDRFKKTAGRHLEGDLSEFLLQARAGRLDADYMEPLDHRGQNELSRAFGDYAGHLFHGDAKRHCEALLENLEKREEFIDALEDKLEQGMPEMERAADSLLKEYVGMYVSRALAGNPLPHGFASAADRNGYTPQVVAALAKGVSEKQLTADHFRDAGLGSLVQLYGSVPKIIEAHSEKEVEPGKTLLQYMKELGMKRAYRKSSVSAKELKPLIGEIESQMGEGDFLSSTLKKVAENNDMSYKTLHSLFNPNYSNWGAGSTNLRKRIMRIRSHWGLDHKEVAEGILGHLRSAEEATLPEIKAALNEKNREKPLHSDVSDLSVAQALLRLSNHPDYADDGWHLSKIVGFDGISTPDIVKFINRTERENKLASLLKSKRTRTIKNSEFGDNEKIDKNSAVDEYLDHIQELVESGHRWQSKYPTAKLTEKFNDKGATIYRNFKLATPEQQRRLAELGEKASNNPHPEAEKYLNHMEEMLEKGELWKLGIPLKQLVEKFEISPITVSSHLKLATPEQQKRFNDLVARKGELNKNAPHSLVSEVVDEMKRLVELGEPWKGDIPRKRISEVLGKSPIQVSNALKRASPEQKQELEALAERNRANQSSRTDRLLDHMEKMVEDGTHWGRKLPAKELAEKFGITRSYVHLLFNEATPEQKHRLEQIVSRKPKKTADHLTIDRYLNHMEELVKQGRRWDHYYPYDALAEKFGYSYFTVKNHLSNLPTAEQIGRRDEINALMGLNPHGDHPDVDGYLSHMGELLKRGNPWKREIPIAELKARFGHSPTKIKRSFRMASPRQKEDLAKLNEARASVREALFRKKIDGYLDHVENLVSQGKRWGRNLPTTELAAEFGVEPQTIHDHFRHMSEAQKQKLEELNKRIGETPDPVVENALDAMEKLLLRGKRWRGSLPAGGITEELGISYTTLSKHLENISPEQKKRLEEINSRMLRLADPQVGELQRIMENALESGQIWEEHKLLSWLSEKTGKSRTYVNKILKKASPGQQKRMENLVQRRSEMGHPKVDEYLQHIGGMVFNGEGWRGGAPYSELAEKFGVNPGTIRNHLDRASEEQKQKLEEFNRKKSELPNPVLDEFISHMREMLDNGEIWRTSYPVKELAKEFGMSEANVYAIFNRAAGEQKNQIESLDKARHLINSFTSVEDETEVDRVAERYHRIVGSSSGEADRALAQIFARYCLYGDRHTAALEKGSAATSGKSVILRTRRVRKRMRELFAVHPELELIYSQEKSLSLPEARKPLKKSSVGTSDGASSETEPQPKVSRRVWTPEQELERANRIMETPPFPYLRRGMIGIVDKDGGEGRQGVFEGIELLAQQRGLRPDISKSAIDLGLMESLERLMPPEAYAKFERELSNGRTIGASHVLAQNMRGIADEKIVERAKLLIDQLSFADKEFLNTLLFLKYPKTAPSQFRMQYKGKFLLNEVYKRLRKVGYSKENSLWLSEKWVLDSALKSLRVLPGEIENTEKSREEFEKNFQGYLRQEKVEVKKAILQLMNEGELPEEAPVEEAPKEAPEIIDEEESREPMLVQAPHEINESQQTAILSNAYSSLANGFGKPLASAFNAVLEYYRKEERPLTSGELSSLMGMTSPSAISHLKNLEERRILYKSKQKYYPDSKFHELLALEGKKFPEPPREEGPEGTGETKKLTWARKHERAVQSQKIEDIFSAMEQLLEQGQTWKHGYLPTAEIAEVLGCSRQLVATNFSSYKKKNPAEYERRINPLIESNLLAMQNPIEKVQTALDSLALSDPVSMRTLAELIPILREHPKSQRLTYDLILGKSKFASVSPISALKQKLERVGLTFEDFIGRDIVVPKTKTKLPVERKADEETPTKPKTTWLNRALKKIKVDEMELIFTALDSIQKQGKTWKHGKLPTMILMDELGWPRHRIKEAIKVYKTINPGEYEKRMKNFTIANLTIQQKPIEKVQSSLEKIFERYPITARQLVKLIPVLENYSPTQEIRDADLSGKSGISVNNLIALKKRLKDYDLTIADFIGREIEEPEIKPKAGKETVKPPEEKAESDKKAPPQEMEEYSKSRISSFEFVLPPEMSESGYAQELMKNADYDKLKKGLLELTETTRPLGSTSRLIDLAKEANVPFSLIAYTLKREILKDVKNGVSGKLICDMFGLNPHHMRYIQQTLKENTVWNSRRLDALILLDRDMSKLYDAVLDKDELFEHKRHIGDYLGWDGNRFRQVWRELQMLKGTPNEFKIRIQAYTRLWTDNKGKKLISAVKSDSSRKKFEKYLKNLDEWGISG